MPRIRLCPGCGSSRVSRSQKRGLAEKALSVVTGLRPYRCLDCDARFFQRKSSHDKTIISPVKH